MQHPTNCHNGWIQRTEESPKEFGGLERKTIRFECPFCKEEKEKTIKEIDDFISLIQKIRDLEQKATPSPWGNEYNLREVSWRAEEPHWQSGWGFHRTKYKDVCKCEEHKDGDFISFLRTNIVKLLDKFEDTLLRQKLQITQGSK